MTSDETPKQERINRYINKNLRVILSDLAKDDLPDEMTDLLMVLRAQDEQMKDEE